MLDNPAFQCIKRSRKPPWQHHLLDILDVAQLLAAVSVDQILPLQLLQGSTTLVCSFDNF